MQVSLVALGSGAPETLTAQCAEALRQAQCILGAERLLQELPEGCTKNRVPAVAAAALLEAIEAQNAQRLAVVFSGDSGFYSGARLLLPLLEEKRIQTEVLPGLSSVQLLAARLGRPWQNWRLCSAHGAVCDPVVAVCHGQPAFFLTGGAQGPAELCAAFAAAGLGALGVTVGEELGRAAERITAGTAQALAKEHFAPLSVLLAEAAPRAPQRAPGLPDSAFVRGAVPMTKQLVRAAVLAKLAVRPGDTLWDVGAGTGSVSVELALAAPEGRVYAVEGAPEACALIRENRARFCAWNLALTEGWAPDALAGLPPPDAVFLGGTKGTMEQTIAAVLQKNANARICVSAIALETVTAAVQAFAAHGLAAHISQLAVSETKRAGSLHMLLANNPVFLIAGNCDA